MDDRKTLILQHINERLTSLKELGKVYSPEKIDELATKLSNSPKTLTEIYTLIDNKFSNQVRKINHNKYLASLQEYYIASIDKLKKNNNCYLLSYEHGIKVLEQANIKELKDINPYIKKVSINNEKIGYQKENSVNNDYELIMSDIAYLLKIEYANTYRIFDKDMKPKGVVNISFETKNEKFLNLEETLQFINDDIQTIGMAAEGEKELAYAVKASEKGAVRFPVCGKMLNFDSPWDGMYLTSRMVKWVTLGGPSV